MKRVKNYLLTIIKYLHSWTVSKKRIKILAAIIARNIPEQASVLDVGCGDGSLAKKILGLRKDITITGLEVLKQEQAKIDIKIFDGRIIPFTDKFFDCVLLIDVLHHTSNSEALLIEAGRVCKRNIIIKDHVAENKIACFVLKLMDWVGNRSYRVYLPYKYRSKRDWRGLWKSTSLKAREIPLDKSWYIFPLNLIFRNDYQIMVNLTS